MLRTLALLTVLLHCLPALADEDRRPPRAPAPPVPEVGDVAPLFNAGGPLEALQGTAPAKLEGEVTVFAFFALWCPGCRNEIPALNALHRDFAKKGLRVVTVSIDRADKRAKLEAFLKEAEVKHPVLLDPDERLKRAWQGPRRTSLPYLVVVDRKGVIRRIDEGFDPAKVPALRRELQDLLSN